MGDKNNKKKKKKKNRINRECTGTLIDANYVLTTTSCCTYCHPLWQRKFMKKQQKEDKLETEKNKSQIRKRRGTGNVPSKSLRQKDNKGNKKKGKNDKISKNERYWIS